MKRTKIILQSLFLVFLVVGSIWIVKRHRTQLTEERCLQPGTQVMDRGFLMNEGSIFGTIYHITYQHTQDLKKEIEACMMEVDASLSMFNPESTIARINAGTANEADSLLTVVFNLSQQIYQATNGCFDPTVAPLVNAWGFGFKNGELPNEQQVDSLKALVGLDGISLVEGKIQKRDTLMIMDFSAIAKGFAVDQVAHLLHSKGIKNYMVEIGGEVIVKGKSSKGKAWRVGIAKPNEDESRDNGQYEEILELQDKAMATSGNYRNFYVTEDGRKLAHTIDPHSGYPVQHSILSSTVFAPDCATADAFATSFMVMGLEKAKQVLEKHPELEVFLIYTDKDGQYQTYNTLKK